MEPMNQGNPDSKAGPGAAGNPVSDRDSTVRPEVVSPTAHRSGSQVVYVPQPMSSMRRWMAWLGWVGCFVCLTLLFGMFARFSDYFDESGGIQERYHSHSKSARDKVAVININGVIASGDGFVKRQIDRVVAGIVR